MLVVAMAAVLVFACFGIGPRVRQDRELASEVQAIKTQVPSVQVVDLSPKAASSDLTLPGNIQAIDSTTVNAQTTGYLQSRFVDVGSDVKKGQLLAIVESPAVDEQVGASLAEVAKSRAGVSQAQADMSRDVAGIASAKAEVAQNRAALSQARADLVGLKAQQTKADSAIRVAESQKVEAQTRLQAAQAELARAQSQYTIAYKTLVRWKALFKVDAVAGQEVDEKQADYDSATAQVAAAKADISTAQAGVAAASDAVTAAQAAFDTAKANVQSGTHRVTSAMAQVQAAQAAVDAAYATMRAGASGVQSASALVQADEANAARYQAIQGFERIVAPFSGVITSRNVDEGDLVGPPSSGNLGGSSDQTVTAPRTGLFGLSKTDFLRIQLEVPQTYSQQIHKGQEADVKVPELPNRVFRGQVFTVAGALDSDTRTLFVEVRLPNPTGELKPGTYATVSFKNLGTNGILIPASTLIFDAEGTRVVEITPKNTVHYIPVQVGRDLGSQVEIVQGLTGHEHLIANPASDLTEGQQVKPVGANY